MLNRREFLSAGAIAAGNVLSRTATASAHPDINTSLGPVRGFTEQNINVFLGLRYGADTRKRRFQPPQAPTPWQEVQEAMRYGPACPQLGSEANCNEDCLFLNVWSPSLDARAKLPVLFYIHGGAYASGSGSSPLYDGKQLASQGYVVVTLNHRLNAFGYLYLQHLADERFADSGNCGQLDIILALQWVRDNIAHFGGDAQRVLAFGQSGGGAKIATMMAMPSAQGLFQRAATMSGQQVTASGPGNATARSLAFLAAAGVDQPEKLLAVSTEKLLRGLEAKDPILPFGKVYFGPVLDMRALQRHPFFPDAAPQAMTIPMIIGNTHDETRAFLRDERYYKLNWETLPAALVPNLRVDIDAHYVVAQYRRLYPKDSPSDIFFRATTAARSWRGAIIEAQERASADGEATYVYQLNFASEVKPQLGAPHTLDIPLVFGNLTASESITGNSEHARAVSALMQKAFTSFAATGKPQLPQARQWPAFTLPTRETLIIDRQARIESDPRSAERKIFARVPYIQPGT